MGSEGTRRGRCYRGRDCIQGSRSEYLAQYVFSMFGTSVPVLHQEDHGIDLFCSLTERKGRRSWPVA